MDLFSENKNKEKQPFIPLADRMRPKRLEDFVGQIHLLGPGKIVREMIEKGTVVSMILWGPPGVGKTTLVKIIADKTRSILISLSAVDAGVRDVRKVIEQARVNRQGLGRTTVLFIDEIHRFNKAQQDALLHSVEDGTIVLIGATTENPSFEIIAPLLSRCRVYTMNPLSDEDVHLIINRALESDVVLGQMKIQISEEVKHLLIQLSAGDGRVALNALELSVKISQKKKGEYILSPECVREAIQKRSLLYDKKGDGHYNTISAFIKSMRGSDPDGAVYWLARMLEAGEDPLFIARRMVILASEDVGNGDPYGLVLANAAFQAVHAVGLPEAKIILAQAATYLASAPKSNRSTIALCQATESVRKTLSEPVPLHLRNAPTHLMREMEYGKDYKYAHDYEQGFVEQEYLPSSLRDQIFYHPSEIGEEKKIKERLEKWWKKRRNKKRSD